jgi:hypothetical protein
MHVGNKSNQQVWKVGMLESTLACFSYYSKTQQPLARDAWCKTVISTNMKVGMLESTLGCLNKYSKSPSPLARDA